MTEETTEKPQSYEDRARAAAPPRKPREQGGGGGGNDGPDPDAWMVTFSDLLTLLMTFFVLIFASSDPVKSKFFEAFGQSQGVFGMFRTSFFQEITAVTRQDVSQDRVQVFLAEVGAVDIEVRQTDEGLFITLPANAYFEPGSARLRPVARQRVAKLAELLKYSQHHIRVVGHSDNQEASRTQYQNAWDLSLARSHHVLQLLISLQIDERRLSVVGYGDTRPRFTNRTRAGRRRNRRVELVIFNRGENP